MRKNSIYFYEGETEKKLIITLKDECKIPHGKLKKFNFWQKDVKSVVRSVSKTSTLYIIFDTDASNPTECDRFTNNINTLEKEVAKVYLIAQHENLEDELCFSCSKSNQLQLFQDFYNTRDRDGFKRGFIRENNLFHKLQSNNFDFETLWARSDIYSNKLVSLSTKIKTQFP